MYGKRELLTNQTGIILVIDQYHYFIPLVKYKWKYNYVSSKQRDIVKLGNHTVLNINNMVPILKDYTHCVIRDIIITNISYKPYRQLLQQRLIAINDKQQEIVKKANWVYKMMCKPVDKMNSYEKQIKKRCFDFKAMERQLSNVSYKV